MSHEQQIKDFVNALLEEFYPECGDIDGGTFQDLAEKHGILIPETRYEPCGEFCKCNEFVYPEEWAEGFKCYRAAHWLHTEQSIQPIETLRTDIDRPTAVMEAVLRRGLRVLIERIFKIGE